jgi:hypothetical protein
MTAGCAAIDSVAIQLLSDPNRRRRLRRGLCGDNRSVSPVGTAFGHTRGVHFGKISEDADAPT